jgi:hypothetical protein
LLEAEKHMIAAKQIANRWYGQVAGVALVALGIALSSVPAPTGALHRMEDKAVQKLTPMMGNTGKQMLAMYAARDTECHRQL